MRREKARAGQESTQRGRGISSQGSRDSSSVDLGFLKGTPEGFFEEPGLEIPGQQ